MIHSIQTAPEETVLVEAESVWSAASKVGRKWDDDTIPQQLHVSKLPSGSLSLGPGQVAIVPVTFLPRFPDMQQEEEDEEEERLKKKRNDDNNNNNNHSNDEYSIDDGRSPPPSLLSNAARVDLVDLVGDERVLQAVDNKRTRLTHTLDPTYRRRNNLDPSSSLPHADEFEVTTTVVVDTSRGVVKLPVKASSIRDNPYRIPDTIKFHHPEFEHNNNNNYDGGKTICESNDCILRNNMSDGANPTTTTTRTTDESPTDDVVILDTIHAMDRHIRISGSETNGGGSSSGTLSKVERECYDLYLSNPMPDTELKILEVLISKPEYISVEFDPRRLAAPDLTLLVESGPSQVLRQWSQDGPLYLPPDSDSNYVLTVCTALDGEVERDGGSELYLDEMAKWIDSGSPDSNLGFLQIRTDAETLFISLEHSEKVPLLSLDNESFATTGGVNNRHLEDVSLPTVGQSSSTLLQSSPKSLDFNMISTRSPSIHAKFGLQNKSPVPIRIMRATVAMNTFGGSRTILVAKSLGLKLNISLVDSDGVNDGVEGQLDSLVLGSATSRNDLMVLSCSLDPDHPALNHIEDSFHFNGTVIIRGTMDTELTYHEWQDETLRNPYRDEHLTLELPFSVTILNGRVEALIERSSHPYPQLFAAQSWDNSGRAVSHLFFPSNRFAAVPGTEESLPPQNYLGSNEIRHDLRILSNMAFPLKIEGIKIVDDDDGGDGFSSSRQSLCNRFNATIAPPNNPDELYYGFEEIGLLILKYKFPGKDRGNDNSPLDFGPLIPKKCSAQIIIKPEEVGTFRVPLLIFSGRLEVSSSDSQPDNTKETTSSDSHALIGFENLLIWSKITIIGKSFIEMLRLRFDDSRNSKSDSQLLSKYVEEIRPSSPAFPSPRFDPILLKVGAIDHDEVTKMPLYFTNYNPVPIVISIDVGEVEGMMIVLSRDGSQTRGDGNNLLDYLPRPGKVALVTKGEYEDHPVDGLLRFLTSNEKSLDFISEFAFRDSVSPYDPAISGSAIFKSLFDWHSRALFHREQIPTRYNSGLHPPAYSAFNATRKLDTTEASSTAFIMSSDRKLFRSLSLPWEKESGTATSDGTKIKLPPGSRAKFEVQVRAPPKDYFENDISQLLSTGLILSTNLGDVMPIYTVFEALQGQLHASHVQPPPGQDGGVESGPNIERYSNTTLINVPVQLSWDNSTGDDRMSDWIHSTAIEIPPANKSSHPGSYMHVGSTSRYSRSTLQKVPLFLKSSFSRPIRLRHLESCNPWFKVTPVDNKNRINMQQSDGVHVGYIQTKIDCTTDDSTGQDFPSYYQCLLNWFSHRMKIQPEGCGIKVSPDSSFNLRRIEGVRTAIEMGLRALERTYGKSNLSDLMQVNFKSFSTSRNLGHIKSGRKIGNGVVADLDIYDSVWSALRVASAYGFDLLSASLRATVEYDSTSKDSVREKRDGTNNDLSLSIHDLAVKALLKPPKLFDSGHSVATEVMEFPATAVGSVAKLIIPLYNPTGVPVRVRLGTAGKPSNHQQGVGSFDRADPHLSYYPAPYIQNGEDSISTNSTSHHLWWDREGGFFIHNGCGDIIQSNHNITIKAGPGALVSLMNPSFHAQVGLLAGCGTRCGLRDERPKVSGHPISHTPIGASAAAGTILSGRKRFPSPQMNMGDEAEPVILAGATPVPQTGGPSAFAIPYSALDEIVIPPYGRGELGPIYFSPPGLYKAVGCHIAQTSGAKLEAERHELCKSKKFESLLYLENSLTGLEKIHLQGRSLWDHLYFVDPLPNSEEDAFGDLEVWEGKPALIFSGTSSPDSLSGTARTSNGKIQHTSVIKEVVLHNGGDMPADIATIGFFSGSNPGAGPGSCSYGSFRLMNCWQSSHKGWMDGKNTTNIHWGLTLEPGKNRTIFIEHVPDCTKREEFVSMAVKLHQSESEDKVVLADQIFASFHGQRKTSRSSRVHNPFSQSEVTLLLGYQMNEVEFAGCTPVDTRLSKALLFAGATGAITPNNSSLGDPYQHTFSAVDKHSSQLFTQVLLLVGAIWLLSYASRSRFHAMWGMMYQKMPIHKVANGKQNGTAIKKKVQSHWNAAFRCLSRADPTSAELQAMSREQMRQVVIGLYAAREIAPPAALNSTSVFSRDRRVLAANAQRQRVTRDGPSGNDRIRTLSDAIFHDTSVSHGSSLHQHFPVGMGWRVAYSRGVLRESSVDLISFGLQSEAFVKKRELDLMEDNFVDYVDDDDDDDGQGDSDYEDEMSDDDEEKSSAPEMEEEESQEPQTSQREGGDSKYEVVRSLARMRV